MIEKKVVDKSKRTFYIQLPFPKIWKNMVEQDRPQMGVLWCMRVAYWITNATDTHSECVILIVFPRQQMLGERACVFGL
jgi:hypothetical protein